MPPTTIPAFERTPSSPRQLFSRDIPDKMSKSRHVSFNVPTSWELGGESIIHCELKPDPPLEGREALIRLTHSNAYGPVDDVRFAVRIGDLRNPTAFEDLDSVTDWTPMDLVEEVVWIDGEEHLRSEIEGRLNPEDENVWAGTFEATLTFPAGIQRIEIGVVSSGHLPSGVISDWQVTVQ